MSWQLLPDPTPEEFGSLKADIADRGVAVPVVIDADSGAVIDGHTRVRAWEELRAEGVRVPDYPREVRRFSDDDERAEFVLSVNLARRHLTRTQRVELVAGLREKGWSLRRIGEAVGVDVATVHRDLTVASPTVPERIVGKDGRSQPAKRPSSMLVTGRRDAERARAALLALPPDKAPPASLARAEELVRLANFEARRAEALPPPRVTIGDGIEVRCGDFREALADVPDGSVDAIVTDPPYNSDGIPLYSDLSEFAARVLKPGRLLVAYCGKVDLPDQLARLGEHLQYVWTGAVFLPGRHVNVRSHLIRGRWRPVAIFSAGRYVPRHWLIDAHISDGNGAKGPHAHHWQQAVGPFVRWVEQVAEPGELVIDPFVGGGTTALACQATGRRFLGADIDPASVSLTLERLGAEQDEAAS